jgi:hypothetical protein
MASTVQKTVLSVWNKIVVLSIFKYPLTIWPWSQLRLIVSYFKADHETMHSLRQNNCVERLQIPPDHKTMESVTFDCLIFQGRPWDHALIGTKYLCWAPSNNPWPWDHGVGYVWMSHISRQTVRPWCTHKDKITVLSVFKYLSDHETMKSVTFDCLIFQGRPWDHALMGQNNCVERP